MTFATFFASLLGALVLAFSGTGYAGAANDLDTPSSQVREDLNLATLEDRLRETRALSPLQKLGLKSEIDTLLSRLRIAHAGGRPEVLALRDPYDRLIARIEGLLRQDPRLARDIRASREAIWGVLADRTQFASLN